MARDDSYTPEQRIQDHFRTLVKFPVWSILPYIEGYEGEKEFDFVIEALAAMVERKFCVVFMDKGSRELLAIDVMHTGEEKAKAKANDMLVKICENTGREFSAFEFVRIEEDFECDDPRAGER